MPTGASNSPGWYLDTRCQCAESTASPPDLTGLIAGIHDIYTHFSTLSLGANATVSVQTLTFCVYVLIEIENRKFDNQLLTLT